MSVQRVLALIGTRITEYVGLQASSGTSSAGQLVALNTSGFVDLSMMQVATTTTGGDVTRIALAADVTAGTAGPVVDGAAALSLFASATLGTLLSNLPTTLPSKPGQAWLNAGVLSVS